MSIIYDALQKAQRARQASHLEPKDEVINKPAGKKIPDLEKLKPYLFGVATILLLSLVFVVSKKVTEQKPADVPDIVSVEISSDLSPAVKSFVTDMADVWHSFTAMLPKRRTIIEAHYKAQHRLNGVYISSDEKIAMINNKMYHRGEEVDGMVISSIDTEGVQMQHEDQVIFIPTQS